uniref:Uncharacterized protein n=1 Tax=Amphimedon queenslandica TaxID=400682 RepID=A0A1X7TBX0_AMPQE
MTANISSREYNPTYVLFLKRSQEESPLPVVSCDYSTAYDTNHLLSGGPDFSVRLWDLFKGILFHTLAVHGGVYLSRILLMRVEV